MFIKTQYFYLEHGEEDIFQEIAGRYLPDAVLENEYGERSLAIDRIEDQRLVSEEYIAYLAQKNTPKPSWWKEFIQKIRMFLSRLPGFENVRMTTDQIETVLARSARNMRKNWYNRRSSVIMDPASQGYAVASGAGEVSRFLINDTFNTELEKQINGNLTAGHIYQLGKPSEILLGTGVPDLPIELSSSHLAKKAKQSNHPFDISDIKDLPELLRNPIGVFAYGDKNKAQNVIVEAHKDGKNFIVGLSFNFTHDGIKVNSIRGLYPKDMHEWLTWIQNGKSLYLNKEKIQSLIHQQQSNLADVEYLDLDSINNIIDNFENASWVKQNNTDKYGKVRNGTDLSDLSDAPDPASQSYAVASGAGEGLRFKVEGRYFKNWQEVIAQFKKDLEGIELNGEQQDIYDVVLQQKDKIRLRINDLNELEDVFVNFGTRKKGIKKLISVHYAGLRNPVTALEVLNIGDVIRRGTLAEEGTAEHPESRRYELKTGDGTTLKVIIDFNRKNDKNKSVINFYSDRKPDTGAHNVSSGIITDLKDNILQDNENASGVSGDLRFSIIGEEGAARLDRELKQNNLDNLHTAKAMLEAGKDAKTIKLATSWEKGGDGKWRMEVPDLKMKTTQLFLGKEEKSRKIISALQKIVNGSEEETVPGLRNDLAQYGGTNDITFCWGNNKKGIYHIAYRRGIDTLLQVIDAVADGKILRFVEGNKTVILEKDGFEAVLALSEYGKQKSWLLSGWKTNTPDASGEVGTQSTATQPEPTFSRQELGAGINNISHKLENASGETDNYGRLQTITDLSDVTSGEIRFAIDREETPAFKKWFDGSKVVDENGKPLVVYHGTNVDFYSFDTENGAWFSKSPEYAESMAEERSGNRIIQCYLSIKNPMTVKIPPQQFAADTALEKSLIKEAKEKGHDGLIIENDTENELEKDVFYIAFHPAQIKSATDNVGTFDPENPDIRFALMDYSEEQIQDHVNILKPFVGVNIDMKEELYREYLKEKGVDIPDEDADLFFRMAVKENRAEILKASLKKNKQDAWNYWRSTNPLIDYLLDFTGDDDFYIVPTEQKGEAFTGSFIAPEYVKWSEKRKKRILPRHGEISFSAEKIYALFLYSNDLSGTGGFFLRFRNHNGKTCTFRCTYFHIFIFHNTFGKIRDLIKVGIGFG